MRASTLAPTTRRAGVVALLATMMLLASCGSSGSTASSTTVKAGSTGSTVAGATTVAGPDNNPTTTTKAKDNSSGNSSKFCQIAREADKNMGPDSEPGDPNADPAEEFAKFKKGFAEVGDALDSLADTAPREIKGDLKLMRDAFGKFYDQIKDAKSFEDLADMDSSLLDSPELTAASDRFEKYLSDECGIKPADDPTANTVAPPSN